MNSEYEREFKRLNWAFRGKTKHLKKNVAGTPLHALQCDFAHLLNDLKWNFSPANRAKCNRFLSGLPNE